MDEQELLERIQAGDEEAFETFYQATNKLVYFHLKKYLSHEEDVWEVLQDVYLAVYQNADRLADRTKWRSWLGGNCPESRLEEGYPPCAAAHPLHR